MFNDMAENGELQNFQENLINMEDNDSDDSDDSEKPEMQFGAIPLGSIFSNMFGASNNENDNSNDREKKKVKVDKKSKKRKTFRNIWH